MSKTTNDQVPEGFERLPLGLGFTDNLQPLYRRVSGDEVSFGLLVEPQHSNMMGICHGGVLMTLADITAATGTNVARGVAAGSPTIQLSIDYISAARQGQWLWSAVEHVNTKRLFGFCSGAIYNSSNTVARFSGTFYFPDHAGMWKEGRSADDVLLRSDD